MNPLINRAIVWAAMTAAAVMPTVFAQTPPPAEVEVASVKFNNVRQSNDAGWTETVIELTAKPSPKNGRFTGRVKVSLNLGVEASPLGGQKQVKFYKASAELVTLETGKSEVRFYLPPEITKRDMLRGDAKFYFVELSIDGKTLDTTKTNVSFATLGNKQALESFRAKIASDASVNDGILVPQYLTLFASDPSRPSPTFIRSESAH